MVELKTVLADLAQRLQAADVPYLVIGGLANAVWGSPRSTIDIDLTIVLDPGEVERLLNALGPAYRPRINDPQGFIERTRVLPLRHAGGVQIDLIFALLPFEEEAVRRAVDVDIVGVPVRFCTPEDLLLHKIVSERERDRKDVEEILHRRRETLDRDYLDPRIHELAALLDRPGIEGRYLELVGG